MSRRARHTSKTVRQSTRAWRRILRRARPLTAGEILVVRHLLQPVRQQRHFSPYKDIYERDPGVWTPYMPWGPPGRYREHSRELALRVDHWERQLPTMLVYHADCWMCEPLCQMYVKGFVPIQDRHWPSGLTLHVDFDPTAADYRALRREVGWSVGDPHVVLSRDLARLQAIIIP